MPMSDRTNKDKVLTLRLDGDTMNKLELSIKAEEITKSDFVRKAILEQIEFTGPIFKNTETAIISKELLKFLLAKLEVPDIHELSRRAVRCELDLLKKLMRDERFMILKKLSRAAPVNNVIISVIKYVCEKLLSSEGRKWFEKIKVRRLERDGNIFTINGRHWMGPKFSFFMKNYLKTILDVFKYKEVSVPNDADLKGSHFRFEYELLHDKDEMFDLNEFITNIQNKLND